MSDNDYNLIKTFKTEAQVQNFFKQSVYDYTLSFQNTNTAGSKAVYRCSFFNNALEQCEDCIYVYKTQYDIKLYQSNKYFFHNHGTNLDPIRVQHEKCILESQSLMFPTLLEWIYVREFYFRKHVNDFLKKRKHWIGGAGHLSVHGTTEIFACGLLDKNGDYCKARLKIVSIFDVFLVYIFLEHNHVDHDTIEIDSDDDDVNIKSEPMDYDETANDQNNAMCLNNLQESYYQEFMKKHGFSAITVDLNFKDKKCTIKCNSKKFNKNCTAFVEFICNSTYPFNISIGKHCYTHLKHPLDMGSNNGWFEALLKYFNMIKSGILDVNRNEDLNYEAEMKRLFLLGFEIKLIFQMFAQICSLPDSKIRIPNEKNLIDIIKDIHKLDEHGKRKSYWNRCIEAKAYHKPPTEHIDLLKNFGSFNNIFEVEDWLEDAKIWRFNSSFTFKTGFRHFFYCHASKQRCAVFICISFESYSDKITMYRSTDLHSKSCRLCETKWTSILNFSCVDEVELYLKCVDKWKKSNEKVENIENQTIYKCHVKSDCPARLRITSDKSGNYTGFSNDMNHNHESKAHKVDSKKIYDIKCELIKLFTIGLSVNAILKNLRVSKSYNDVLDKIDVHEFCEIVRTKWMETDTSDIISRDEYLTRSSTTAGLGTCSCPGFKNITDILEKNWQHIDTFYNVTTLEEFFKQNETWKYSHCIEFAGGIQHHFKCRKIPFAETNCSALLNVVFYCKFIFYYL